MKSYLENLFLQHPTESTISSIAGRLLTEVEMDSVMGGNSSHSQSSGSYTQQSGGSSYSQDCGSCSYNQGGGAGGG